MSDLHERKPLGVKTGSTHGTFGPGSNMAREIHLAHHADVESPLREKEYSLQKQIKQVFLSSWQLKLLLAAVPVSLFSGTLALSQSVTFLASFFGLIPLAALLGDFTEDIALRSNDVIGALINVTFGNATELVISIMALRAGLFELIKLSLIGSILGNMLLVLGSAFVIGGMKHKVLRYNSSAANTYNPLLMLSVMSFVIPSGFSVMQEKELRQVQTLHASRQIAAVTAIVYAAYLFFQLFTHKAIFDAEHSDDDRDSAVEMKVKKREDGDEEESGGVVGIDDDEDGEEGPMYTLAFALGGLALVSIILSVLSDNLVTSLEPAAQAWNCPPQFISIILVPIVGNAAEHASALLMAAKNKVDISIGVAIGSSIQIALFVMPVLVLAGWAFNVPLDMNFHAFPTSLLFISVLVTNTVTADGKSNWLEGLMLIAAYIMIAITFLNGSFAV